MLFIANTPQIETFQAISQTLVIPKKKEENKKKERERNIKISRKKKSTSLIFGHIQNESVRKQQRRNRFEMIKGWNFPATNAVRRITLLRAICLTKHQRFQSGGNEIDCDGRGHRCHCRKRDCIGWGSSPESWRTGFVRPMLIDPIHPGKTTIKSRL